MVATSVAVSPDGATFAVGCNDGALQVWDVKTQSCRQRILVGRGYISAMVFDRTGNYIYTACNSGVGRVNLATGNVEHMNVTGVSSHLSAQEVPLQDIDSLTISPDGKDLVISSGRTVVWSLQNSKERFSASASRNAAISPDGLQLAIANNSTLVEIWDFHSGQRLQQLPFQKDERTGAHLVKFSPDGKILVAALNQGNALPSYLAIWRVATYSHPTVFLCHKVAMHDMCFLPATNTLVTAADDYSLRFWDLDHLTNGVQ